MERNPASDQASDESVSDGSDIARLGWILVAVQVALLLAFILAPKRQSISDMWPPNVAELLGGILLGVGIAIMAVAFVGLGSALTATPVPQNGSALRTGGAYGVVRHPIYDGLLVACLGFLIAIGSWWQVAIYVVLIVFFLFKANWEDNLLADRHGVKWYDYADHVGGFVPRLRSSR